jgi:kumamolisin
MLRQSEDLKSPDGVHTRGVRPEDLTIWRVASAGFILTMLSLAVLPFMIPAIGAKGFLSPALSPCLLPSSADTSTAAIQPSSASSIIPDFAPSAAVAHASASPMPPDYQLHMEFIFRIRNAVSFSACLDAIQDPSSPYYRQFLNNVTLEPYVPTPGQMSSVASYLQGRGLAVAGGPSPLVLEMSGTVGTVESAFSTTIDLYGAGGGPSFYAPSTYPSMPGSLAAVGLAIEGMDNYSHAAPLESPCTGPYCPQGIQVGYSITPLLGAGATGAGVKVAVVDEPGDPNPQAAVNTYDSQYSLPSAAVTVVEPDGAPSSWNGGWASEAAMDIEAVHTAAPGASIFVLYGSSLADDPMNLVDYVASHHTANIASNSWGYDCGSPINNACSDAQLGSAEVSSVDSRLAIDSAQGLTILFASGDQGATPDGTNRGVEFPGSDVNVLAVGATNLVLSGCTASTCTGYGSEMGAKISGGGYSGYFPEPVWQSAAKPGLTGRGVPDVSMLGFAPNFWVYSTLSDQCGMKPTPVAGWFGCAGTSLSTPLWAGVVAIIEQENGGGLLGNVAPRIWGLANTASYPSEFHDVTSGTNSDPYSGYPATVGWDPVTGWGSPVASKLVNASASLLTTTTSTTTTSTATSILLLTTTSTSTVLKTTTSTSTSVVTTTVNSTSTTYVPVATTTVATTVTVTATMSTTLTSTISSSTSTTSTSSTTTVTSTTTSASHTCRRNC